MGSSSHGCVKGEGFGTARATWYVCFPAAHATNRIVTFSQMEYELAERTLDLFRIMRWRDEGMLQLVGSTARGVMRERGLLSVEALQAACLTVSSFAGVAALVGESLGSDSAAAREPEPEPEPEPQGIPGCISS